MPIALTRSVDRACRNPLDIGFLDRRRQRFLRHPPRLEKAGDVAALPQLRDAQLDRAGARLPDPIAIAVAVVHPVGMAFAMRRAGHALNIQLHQALRRKSDHLAQQLGIGALLQKLLKVHHLLGHRRVLA